MYVYFDILFQDKYMRVEDAGVHKIDASRDQKS